MSLAEHLRSLPAADLTALLRRRTDVLVEPAPRDLTELADRLTGVDSLSLALGTLDGDEVGIARVLAMTGPLPVGDLARVVRAPLPLVAAAVDRLASRALCWPHGGRLHLPAALAEHLADDVLQFPPAAALVPRSRVADLQAALRGLGGDPQGRKPDLAARLVALLGDPDVRQRAVARLSPAGLRSLAAALSGAFLFGDLGGARELREAGLLLGDPHQGAVPREIAVDVLLADTPPVTGPPELPAAAGTLVDGRAAAEAAVQAVTALLDEAVAAPLAALKKGGIGLRERKRLAARLGGLDPALAIDLAAAQGLLGAWPGGYGPTPTYASWRDAPLARRWARLVRAWWDVEHHPTARRDGDGEVPPPLPVLSTGGTLRRALLRAAAGGRSLDAAAAHVEWFCPLHALDASDEVDLDLWDGDDAGADEPGSVEAEIDARLAAAVATVRAEADALGVTSGDRLTELGERLVAGTLDELDDLLPESRGLLVLQSDLSAVVSGQADAAAVRVLTAAAVPEGRGAAVTWRFTPASVRAALDAGWTADELRAALVAAGGRELPQPLDYLIGDVARRHGSVRVRETRCCVTGAEVELSEILHTRALAKLELRRLAPTVLVTPAAPDDVLAALRRAGFAPVPEDVDGAVLVAARPAGPSPSPAEAPWADRAPLDADVLAARLLTGPPAAPPSDTATRLAALNPDLDSAEIGYLADALDHGRVVRVRYRNSAGNHSVRDIAPVELWERFLRSHCLLRDDQRDFAVAGFEVVGPAR